jgi:L-2-hydroxyglutarate oxidase LhgO
MPKQTYTTPAAQVGYYVHVSYNRQVLPVNTNTIQNSPGTYTRVHTPAVIIVPHTSNLVRLGLPTNSGQALHGPFANYAKAEAKAHALINAHNPNITHKCNSKPTPKKQTIPQSNTPMLSTKGMRTRKRTQPKYS